jgi:hypothetical protein
MKRREIRFFIDPATDQPHIYEHNIDESEVQEILSKPLKDEPSRDNSRIALGKTVDGRYLKVIYSPDEDGVGIFVITAYDLTGNALAAFRKRLRR